MYLNNPAPNMLFRPVSKSPRPLSRTDSKNKASFQVKVQFKPSPYRRPPSFLAQRHQEDVEPSVVISAPQNPKKVSKTKKDESVKKQELPSKIHLNKSANKYQQDASNQNTSNNRSFQKEVYLNVKHILPPRARKSSDSNININSLLEKIKDKEEIIKEIQKIADNKISDNIRKTSEEQHKNGQVYRKERSIQKQYSKPKLQTRNNRELISSIASEPSTNLKQLSEKQQNSIYNRNPEQPKTKERQRSNYIWSPKQIKPQSSASITGDKSRVYLQRPHSYLDLLSDQKHKKISIETSSSLIFGNNSLRQPPSRKNSQVKNLTLQSDKFSNSKYTKSVLTSAQLKDSRVKQPLSTKKRVSIKDFIMKKTLGEGKFGIVYQAFHVETNTLYALKKISKQVIKSSLMVDQLLQEIKIQFYCNHQNILKIYGFFDDSESVYLILEYMQEGTLFSHFKKQKTLTQQQAANMLKQIASGIVYLQQNGIAHRDIKPQNIVMSNGVGKLCDFGWAAICTDRRKTYCGTFDYVAPEILQGNEYEETVDLWCLGVMAYELMIGKAPFYHISRQQTMKKIMSANLDFPSYLSKNAISFIESLIRKNPQQRLNGQDILKHPFLTQKSQLHEIRRGS